MGRILDILWNIRILSPTPMLVLRKEGSIFYHSHRMRVEETEAICQQIERTLSGNTADPIYPQFQMIGDAFAYGICSDNEGRYYILGPVAIGEYSNLEKCKLSCNTMAWYTLDDSIICRSLNKLQAELQLLFCCLTNETDNQTLSAPPDRDILENECQNYQFEMTEYEMRRNTYEEILPLLDAVRRGDREGFLESYDSTLVDRVGKLASTSFKQAEYLAVKVISLFMHAMIEGGVDYRTAYDTSDIYLQKLEHCKDIFQIRELQSAYVELAIDLVDQKKMGHFDIIEAAKEYIRRNRNKRFSISQMAKEININSSYLSRYFSQKEHMTIQQYITLDRVKSACNMLAYSDYSITDISNYLCFSSQSHFSFKFKQIMSVTPSEYRKQKRNELKYKEVIHG